MVNVKIMTIANVYNLNMEADIQEIIKQVKYIRDTYNVDVTVSCKMYGSPIIDIKHNTDNGYNL